MTPNPVMHSSDGVSIRDYIDLRFTEFQRAVDKAEATMGSRLAGMNEFRDTLKDQASRFITRDDLRFLQDEVKSLRKITDMAEGKASQNSVLWSYAIGAIGIILGVIHLFK
jgi:hypothetical protein